MVECNFDSRTCAVRIRLPLSFRSSTDLIRSHYMDVKAGVTVAIFAVKLLSLGDIRTKSFISGTASATETLLQLKKPSTKMEETL